MPHAGSKATWPFSRTPPRGGSPLAAERTIAVIQAWGKPESAAIALSERVERCGGGMGARPRCDRSILGAKSGGVAEGAVTGGGLACFSIILIITKGRLTNDCDGRDACSSGRRSG